MTTLPLAQTDWDDLPTPAFLVDVPRLDRNIAETARSFRDHGVPLRPHFKTHKCLEVIQRQLGAGAIGFTCSTPAEFEVLAERGIGGLLYAHQPVGRRKVDAVTRVASGHDLMAIADSAAVAKPLSASAAAAGFTLRLLLDVNVGQGRTGVDPDQAVCVAREIAALPGLTLQGVVTHEGHLMRYTGDRAALEAEATAAGSLLATVADQIRTAGLECPIVSIGSTAGIHSSPFAPGITEGRPGTYVYFDANQVRIGTTDLDHCASGVLTRVISVNRAGSDETAIIDAGTKAMSSDALTSENGVGIVVDMSGQPLPKVQFTASNEEHGFLKGDGTADLAVGDLLRVIPNHACGTTNMWSQAFAVHQDGRVEVWPILARH